MIYASFSIPYNTLNHFYKLWHSNQYIIVLFALLYHHIWNPWGALLTLEEKYPTTAATVAEFVAPEENMLKTNKQTKLKIYLFALKYLCFHCI